MNHLNDNKLEAVCAKNPLNDPEGAPIGKGRVVRGGSWQQTKSFSRLSYRSSHAPTYKSGGLGLRLAL